MSLRKFYAIVLVLVAVGTAVAQQMPSIPQDPDVKIGKLANGLTYYIRHNEFPKGVASYYIAQKVGSLQEEESQRGLAHLLEHLAFNGTKHFKGNTLREYLQSIGVEYGRNLNAATGIESTVYYFTDVPTARLTAVDSCMLILKDWSDGITLSTKAIDEERDVVHNEYRQRQKGFMRLFERALPTLFPDSKYGHRLPIGLMSVIDSCNPDVLRDYYIKWYRPDNQAIIVVGDVDVNYIEKKIQKLFGKIKVAKNAAKVQPEAIPDNEKAIYFIDKDKELPADMILTFLKHDPVPDQYKNTIQYLAVTFIQSAISGMLSERLQEKAQEPDCPFLGASASDGEFLVSNVKQAVQLSTQPKPGKTVEAWAATLTEARRAAEFGFTATEYQRFCDEYMSRLEKAYANRDKMKNDEFTQQYLDHFQEKEPIPSLEQEYNLYKQFVPAITLDIINQTAKSMIRLQDRNFVVFAALAEREGATYPTADDMAAAKSKVLSDTLSAYVDNAKQEPLMASVPQAGSIVKTTVNNTLGFKELELSNGAKVILKKTDFKDNEIILSGYAKGGFSCFPESQAVEASTLTEVASCCGVGNFSSTELGKALAGKQAHVGLRISETERSVSGSSTPKDLETMMQLLYLKMTALSKDEKCFENLRQQIISMLSLQSGNPDIVFQDSLGSTLSCGSKFGRMPQVQDIQAIDYDRALSTIRDMYGNARDFTFVIVGNYDEATLLPLINTYMASLPNNGKTYSNRNLKEFHGEVSNIFTMPMETPQNRAQQVWRSDAAPNTQLNRVALDISSRMLSMAYDRSIREELSAAYSAQAGGDISLDADGGMHYIINGVALINPAKSKDALPLMISEMQKLIQSPSATDLKKAKEIVLNQADIMFKTNSYWVAVITKLYRYGIDFHSDYKQTINAVDTRTVSDFLQNVILKSGHHAQVVMEGIQAKK